MDKKSLLILLVTSAFASSAFAYGGFLNKLTKHTPASSAVKSKKVTKQTKKSYVDFSGTWIPDCGMGPSEPVMITNDEHYIAFNGDEERIGQGLQSRNSSNESYVNLDNYSIEWNEDGTALSMKGVTINKSNYDNSVVETDIGKFTLTMKNDQINLDGKFSAYEDDVQVMQDLSTHCVFTKAE